MRIPYSPLKKPLEMGAPHSYQATLIQLHFVYSHRDLHFDYFYYRYRLGTYESAL